MRALIPLIMPQIPPLLLPILLTEHWNATHTLPKIPKPTPILFLSGINDTLIPQCHMVALRGLRSDGSADEAIARAGNRDLRGFVHGPKESGFGEKGGKWRWREFEGEHNDTCMTPAYWREIGLWMEEELGVTPPVTLPPPPEKASL